MTDNCRIIKVGILTVSDSCYNGKAEDKSGENLKALVEGGTCFKGSVTTKDIIHDEQDDIKAKLLHWSDHLKLDVILTTGGTGFSPRDVTPEATKAVIEKEAMGMTIAMMKGSLDITPLAMLSRLVCGIRGSTLIINLPGSKKGSAECLQIVSSGVTHAVDLLHDQKSDIESTHTTLQAEGIKSVRLSGSDTDHSSSSASSHHHHRHHKHHSSHHSDPHHHHHHHHHHKSKHDHSHSSTEHIHSEVNKDQVARRPRESPHPIISVDEALAKVLENAPILSTEDVGIKDALGRYLVEDVTAAEPLPPFPASIKDGYAVIASDGDGLRSVLGEAAAGDMPTQAVTAGSCVRINTGAPIPPGTDAVIQVEDTQLVEASEDGKTEISIKLLTTPRPGQEIRQVGSDIERGQVVLYAGQRLGAAELGVMATVGVTTVKCYRLPVVGVMSTGNELVNPEDKISEGKIRDANRTSLLAQLLEYGVPCVDLGIARDTPDAVKAKFLEAIQQVDIVVTTGGVSMGDKDYLKEVLEVDLKATLHFARVFMKPGKPTTFATLGSESDRTLFFGLPGNPVSALVTCNLYVIPAIRHMMGCPHPNRTVIKVKIDRDLRLDPRPEYHRATLTFDSEDPIPTAHTTGNQISSRLLSLRSASILMKLPPKTDTLTTVEKGRLVDAIVIGRL